MKNDYEQRQDARRERYEQQSEKATDQAGAEYRRAFAELEHIPPGQPILVGHHSEHGHRAALNRADNAMRRSAEQSSKAEHYAQKAASVGCAGVSSDDPSALQQLRAKLARRESDQALMKTINKTIRANRAKPEADQVAALVALQFREEDARALLRPDWCGRVGYPDYRLKNNNAEIRRIRARIAELERAEQATETAEQMDGFAIEQSPEHGRVFVRFDQRPPRAVCQYLKGAGWRWAPSVGAWSRHLNDAGQAAARRAAADLPALLAQ